MLDKDAVTGSPTWAATRADDFPRQADEYGQAADDHARSRTHPDDAERRTGIYVRRSSLRPEGGRVVAGLRSGDGPLSVRVRPSSIKRDCDRRATSTGEKCLVNVHAKSRLTLEPLRTLRSETKGQAGACPDRTRAIPCKVRVGLLPDGLRRVDSNGDSNSSDHRRPAATGDSA